MSLFLHSNLVENTREAQFSTHILVGKEDGMVSGHISLVKDLRLFSFPCQMPALEVNWNENKIERAFDTDTVPSLHVCSLSVLSDIWAPSGAL